MQFAIVPSSQLAETERWDAQFHIVLIKHRKIVDEMMANLTKGEIIDLARQLPYDTELHNLLVKPAFSHRTKAHFEAYLAKLEAMETPIPGRWLPVAIYCAVVSKDLVSKILGEVLELSKRKKELLERLKNTMNVAEEKQCTLLVKAMKGKEEPSAKQG